MKPPKKPSKNKYLLIKLYHRDHGHCFRCDNVFPRSRLWNWQVDPNFLSATLEVSPKYTRDRELAEWVMLCETCVEVCQVKSIRHPREIEYSYWGIPREIGPWEQYTWR